MRSPNIRYLPGVDHLRAFAALLIVLYHGHQLLAHLLRFGQQPSSARRWDTHASPLLVVIIEGHTAVALFMVLSGFIFAFGTVDKEISFRRFMGNRLWRIFPLMVFVLLCAVATFPAKYTFLGFLQTLTLQSNLPGAFSIDSYTGMFWAIGVEFQFYLVFPFLMAFYQRNGLRYLLGVLALFMVWRALGTFASRNARDISYSTILGRMDQFLFGMMAGIAYVRRHSVCARLKWALLPAAMLVEVMSYALNRLGGWPTSPMWKMGWPTIEGIVWAFFVLCYLSTAERLPAVVSRLLSFVGELSFSIYLTHFLVIRLLVQYNVVLRWVENPDVCALLNTVVIVIPATLLLSTLTYLVIEKPFLRMRRSYVQPRAVSPAS